MSKKKEELAYNMSWLEKRFKIRQTTENKSVQYQINVTSILS